MLHARLLQHVHHIHTLPPPIWALKTFDIIATYSSYFNWYLASSKVLDSKKVHRNSLLLSLLFYIYRNNLSSPCGSADHTNPPGNISLSTVYEEPVALLVTACTLKTTRLFRGPKMGLWSLLMWEKKKKYKWCYCLMYCRDYLMALNSHCYCKSLVYGLNI